MSVIDTATNTVTATITVGAGPVGVAVSPDGTRAYVTNLGDDTVSVIDTATNTVTATIPVGDDPVGVAVSPDGTRAYVTNYQRRHGLGDRCVGDAAEYGCAARLVRRPQRQGCPSAWSGSAARSRHTLLQPDPDHRLRPGREQPIARTA